MMEVYTCSSCGHSVVGAAVYCPHCLVMNREPKLNWFPTTTENLDNTTLQHELVPEHRVLPEARTKKVLKEYGIDRQKLPRIQESDPAIQHLTCGPGDVVEVVRDSRTAETATNYRVVVSSTHSGVPEPTATEEWRNPTSPAEDLYTAGEELTENRALHILDNLSAHVPPSDPGACEAIAVTRESQIDQATDRVRNGEPYTFIEGELGYGKSFFLYWVRDRMFPTTAISFVELDDSLVFSDRQSIADAFLRNLETPRSSVNDRYANGLDELWDTLLRQLANQCANYYEGQGYEVRENHIAESLERAVGDVLDVDGVPSELTGELATAARGYFGSSVKSLTQILDESAPDMEPTTLLRFAARLAALSGYQILFGVDELEKSDRSEDHFRSIETFVEEIPQGISLFVTGTPELVVGGEEGNAMKATYQPLFERTRQNRIVLEAPSKEELIAFAERVTVVERAALSDAFSAEYTEAIEAYGGSQATVEAFLKDRSPSFRAFLTFLEG